MGGFFLYEGESAKLYLDNFGWPTNEVSER